MSNLINIEQTQTMTLYEVCKLTESTHRNALRFMPKLMENPEFGPAAQIEHLVKLPQGGSNRVVTYVLNKEQSYVVAARRETLLIVSGYRADVRCPLYNHSERI